MAREGSTPPPAPPSMVYRTASSVWRVLTLDNIRSYYPQVLGGLLFSGVLYLSVRGALSFTSTLLHIGIEDAFLAGAASGGMAVTALVVGGVIVYNRSVISTQSVAAMAQRRIARATAVTAAFGTPLTFAPLRAFSVIPGHMARGAGGLAWVEPVVSGVWSVRGPLARGVVTVEAVNRGRKGTVFSFLCVDVLHKDGETSYVLEGEPGNPLRAALRAAGTDADAMVVKSDSELLSEEKAREAAEAAAAAKAVAEAEAAEAEAAAAAAAGPGAGKA